MEPQQPILVYRSLMELAKTRIACIRRIADGSLSLGDDRLNWELAALQLRMVLELVAFASLSAHKEAYALGIVIGMFYPSRTKLKWTRR